MYITTTITDHQASNRLRRELENVIELYQNDYLNPPKRLVMEEDAAWLSVRGYWQILEIDVYNRIIHIIRIGSDQPIDQTQAERIAVSLLKELSGLLTSEISQICTAREGGQLISRSELMTRSSFASCAC